MNNNHSLITGVTATANRGNQVSVSAANLRAFLLSNSPKQFKDKAKIRYIDCQSKLENTGTQLVGALHMDLPADYVAPQVFEKMMVGVAGVLEDLVTADVVVIYCSFAAVRSPATFDVYRTAYAKHPKRNINQKTVLLEGGITAYKGLQSPYGITQWLGPAQAKVLAKVPKATKPTVQQSSKPVPQPKDQPENAEDFLLYTDP